MKEKLEVDTRQVGALVVGGLLALGTVFGAGVYTGRRLTLAQHATVTPDLLTSLDQKAKALDEVQRATTRLTFQEELTRKADPVRVAEAMPLVNVEKSGGVTTASLVKLEAKVNAGSDSGVNTVDTDAVQATAAAPKPAPSEKPADKVKPAVAASSEKKTVVAVAPSEKPATKPVALRDSPPAEATATRTLPDGGGAQVKGGVHKVPETAPNGAYTLQLGASQDKDEANKQVAKLRDRGYAPYLVTAQVAGKGTWYRVRMGSFASKDAANRYLADFHRETQLEAFVASTK